MIRMFNILWISAIVIVACAAHDYEYELEISETRTWPATGINQILGSTENGGISVLATQDTIITADITKKCLGEDSIDAAEHIDDIEITESIAGGQLSLDADMPDDGERNYQASFDMTAPASIYVDLTTVNGAISINDMTAGAKIRITNGAITTENLRGGVDGETVNGAIDCDLALLAINESAILETTNGAVTLSLPPDVSAIFDAATVNGEVTITGFSSVTYTVDQLNHKAGVIGSGGAIITINVVNGNITIRAR